MRKIGIGLVLDLEALGHAEGEFKNLEKENKNPCAWIVGKWLGSPLVPSAIARVIDRIIALMKGHLT